MAKKANPSAKTDKQAKGVEIANKRIPKTLKSIKLIGNLSSYGLTEPQKSAIVAAMRKAVDTVEKRLAGTVETEAQFKL